MNVEWTDTITVPDPNRNYSCFAIVNLEDYNACNTRTYRINTCQTKRPMQFLQYNLFSEEMNPELYKEKPQIEKRNTSDKIQLSFLINSDKLTDTPENAQNLNMLKNKLTGCYYYSSSCRFDTVFFLEYCCEFLNVFHAKVNELFSNFFKICHFLFFLT